jgi:hypothetical protein
VNLVIAYVAATFVAMVFKWSNAVRWVFMLIFFLLPFVGWLAVVITLFVIVFGAGSDQFKSKGNQKQTKKGKGKGKQNKK